MPVPAEQPDVVFVSYQEPNADENFARLQMFTPGAKRVHGVKGVFNAWRKAAETSAQPYFYLVEADSWIVDGFSFGWPEDPVAADIYLWTARNAVNGLVWYNGGLKLLSREAALSMDPNAVDFFLSMKGRRKSLRACASETRFNATPFLAWRCGFRECTKLAGGLVQLPQAGELLRIWQTVGADKPNGRWCMLGARMGAEFGKRHFRTNMLLKVNDMDWQKAVFAKLEQAQGRQPGDAP